MLTVKSDAVINSIEVYDLNGILVASTSAPSIDLSTMSAGMYVVKITSGNDQVVKTIIKQ